MMTASATAIARRSRARFTRPAFECGVPDAASLRVEWAQRNAHGPKRARAREWRMAAIRCDGAWPSRLRCLPRRADRCDRAVRDESEHLRQQAVRRAAAIAGASPMRARKARAAFARTTVLPACAIR